MYDHLKEQKVEVILEIMNFPKPHKCPGTEDGKECKEMGYWWIKNKSGPGHLYCAEHLAELVREILETLKNDMGRQFV